MRLIFVCSVLLCAACKTELPPNKASGERVYTLYRSGALVNTVRIHVATFETTGEDEAWNMKNCEQVARILNEAQKKEQYQTKLWCEKGRYKE